MFLISRIMIILYFHAQVAHVASNVGLASLIMDFPKHRDNGEQQIIKVLFITIQCSSFFIDLFPAEILLLKARSENNTYKPPSSPPPDESTSKRSNKKHNRSTWTPSSLMKHSKQYIVRSCFRGLAFQVYYQTNTPTVMVHRFLCYFDLLGLNSGTVVRRLAQTIVLWFK